MTHVIKHNKKTVIPTHFIFFDSEAYEKDISETQKQQLFRLAVACYHRRDCKTERWCVAKTQEELADFVASKIGTKKVVYALAHNLFYDLKLTNIIHHLCFKHKYKIENVFVNSADSLIITLRKDKRKIVFLDSLNIMRASIKQLGDMLGLPKLDIDVFTDDEETLTAYCKRDVEILKTAILQLCDFLEKEDLGSFGWTVASTSMKVFRHKFMKHKIFIHDKTFIQELERNAYYGGRVEVFKCGVEIPDCYKLDVNSMYPYVMRNNKFPVSLKRYLKNITTDALKHYLKQGNLAIAHVEIDTNEPAYPYRHKNKLYFPVGKFETYLSTPELKYALKHNHITKIYEVALYRGAPIFKEFVEYLYNKRQEAKKQNNTVYATFYKYILNSLYGKFAQRQRDVILTIDTNEPVYYKRETSLNGKTVEEIGFYNKIFYISKDEKFSYNAFCAIADHVTAYARLYLYQLIKKAGFKNVFYVDTDSLFTNRKGYENLKSHMDDYELGKLKLEETGKMIAWNVKHYQFEKTFKCKAIPKKADLKEDGNYYWWSFERLKGSLSNPEHDGVFLTLRHRQPKKPYDKRKVLENGNTIPLTVDEITKIK